jgi:hypothetical protein
MSSGNTPSHRQRWDGGFLAGLSHLEVAGLYAFGGMEL